MSRKRAPSLRELRRKLPGNVVILPTAAARQVQQPPTRQGREERQRLREAHARAFPFKDPHQRTAEKRAELLTDAGKSPAIVLALVILSELDREARENIIHRLERSSDECTRQALEFARTTVMTVGEQSDLMRALDAIHGGENATDRH